jgi:hypothetical protein
MFDRFFLEFRNPVQKCFVNFSPSNGVRDSSWVPFYRSQDSLSIATNRVQIGVMPDDLEHFYAFCDSAFRPRNGLRPLWSWNLRVSRTLIHAARRFGAKKTGPSHFGFRFRNCAKGIALVYFEKFSQCFFLFYASWVPFYRSHDSLSIATNQVHLALMLDDLEHFW